MREFYMGNEDRVYNLHARGIEFTCAWYIQLTCKRFLN